MKTARTVLLAIGLVAIAILAYLALERWGGYIAHPRWDQVRMGDARQQVVGLMGDPDEETDQFRLGPREDNERMYMAAEESGAKTWLLYRTGPNVTHALGLDAGGRVVFKGRGGT